VRRIAAWFPEWAGDARSAITLRDVLTHTSGLKVLSSGDVYNARDIVQLALSSPVATIAGVEYRYRNSTFNLLAGIVHRATGQHLDQVAEGLLFHWVSGIGRGNTIPLVIHSAWQVSPPAQMMSHESGKCSLRMVAGRAGSWYPRLGSMR
jgi:hypothetical protein